MNVHGRDREIVMIVLNHRQPLGEGADLVIIDIDQGADARTAVILVRHALQTGAYQITQRFRAILITAVFLKAIEILDQVFIESCGNAFHGRLPPFDKARQGNERIRPRSTRAWNHRI